MSVKSKFKRHENKCFHRWLSVFFLNVLFCIGKIRLY